ncbi:MAG: hypothetical protein LBV68_07095 [Spirochaetaceae bacterium]|jgi:hypothetical protein|nr:hypothetical protein [Spirochaetaceae bacterium]
MKQPTLVILAAGMGSRYGGLKQIDRVGKGGEALLDYSVFDALRSGFDKIVFIIRRDIEKDFRDIVLARMGASVRYELAFQEPESLLPKDILENARKMGRTKPWGTAHALLCAESCIDSPFALINADDFYGREAFAIMGKYLSNPALCEGAIVPYKLEKTLSATGTVARGVCIFKDEYLESVHELKSIRRQEQGIFNTEPDGSRQELAADTPVSMNFWGFPPMIFPELKCYFKRFLENSGKDIKSECYIPLFADELIKKDLLKIKALHANAEWFGVTYQDDKQAVEKRIEALTAEGVYPDPLWK